MIWSRWSGAGNTFYLASIGAADQFRVSRSLLAKELCSKFPNAPTDGVLFLEKQETEVDAKWDFYNSDGSTAEMCGNAARCATAFLASQAIGQKEFSFLTLAGKIHSVVLSQNQIQVEMPKLKILETDSKFLVNSGVPHIVISGSYDEKVALELRPYPAPNGSNITFVTEISHGFAKAVTFERGVEGPTLACGTGAVAAAAYLAFHGQAGPIEIQMPGGTLQIQKAMDGSHPLMQGPAEWCFDYDDNEFWEEEK